MSIAYDNADSIQGSSTGVSSKTKSFTVGGGNNRCLLVYIFYSPVGDLVTSRISSVTFDGIPLARATTHGYIEFTDNAKIEAWYLTAPHQGAHDLVITFTEVTFHRGSSIASYSGVDQSSPVEQGSTASSNIQIASAATSLSAVYVDYVTRQSQNWMPTLYWAASNYTTIFSATIGTLRTQQSDNSNYVFALLDRGPFALTDTLTSTITSTESANLRAWGISLSPATVAAELPTYNASLIAAVARVSQSLPVPTYVIGGRGGSSGTTYSLFKKSSTHTLSVWRSQVFRIGEQFDVIEIVLPLGTPLAASMEIIPVLYLDDGSTTCAGTPINIANYATGTELIVLTSKNFDSAPSGEKNFYLELQFTGSVLSPVLMPITIDVEKLETT